MYWAFRYRYNLWVRWNYLLGAAFDAGFNFNMLLIFLFFGRGRLSRCRVGGGIIRIVARDALRLVMIRG
jgi:hypothetical protein